jgi:mono/diheme cytochrome c family protein
MPCSWELIWPFKPNAHRLLALLAAVMSLFIALPAFPADHDEENDLPSPETGKTLYQQTCVLCHGIEGKGDGPDAFYIGAYSAPRPRDLTSGELKFRSTHSGELPTDEDLFRTITQGITGYMPSFQSLSDLDRRHLVAYLKTLSPFFREDAGHVLSIPPGPFPATPASIQQGRILYQALDCDRCHGPQVDGPYGLLTEGKLKDRRGLSLRPRDLSRPSSFKNGHSPTDIARTILTGLDGSPMASYREALEPNPENIWHLVNYILSLSSSHTFQKD